MTIFFRAFGAVLVCGRLLACMVEVAILGFLVKFDANA